LDGKGVERWSCALSNLSFAGSAAVAGGTVVVAGVDGAVAGLDSASGKILWQAPGSAALRHGPRAVRAGETWAVVLLAPENGVLRCLDARDGRELWASEPTNRSDGPPAAEGGLIAFGNCDSAIHLFNATNGVQIGQVPVGAESQMAGGVCVAEGRVYGGTRSGELVCVDVASLALSWHVSVASSEAFGTPVAARGLAVMGTPDGAVAAFDAKTGEQRWKVSVSNTVSMLCVVDDAVFAAAAGTLLGMRLTDGAIFAKLPVGDNIAGPSCENRVIAVADDGGNVIALAGE
jgi:outer membrane protein assembly factor BamB